MNFQRHKREQIILYKIYLGEELTDNAHEFHTCVGKILLNNIKVNVLWDFRVIKRISFKG